MASSSLPLPTVDVSQAIGANVLSAVSFRRNFQGIFRAGPVHHLPASPERLPLPGRLQLLSGLPHGGNEKPPVLSARATGENL